MISVADRAAGLLGRQVMTIIQLEATIDELQERNGKLQVLLEQISKELAFEKSKGAPAIKEPPTEAESPP